MKEVDEKGDDEVKSDFSFFIDTVFDNDNSYYRKYHAGWIEFVSEDFEYDFPYSTEEYFATYIINAK